MIIAKSAGRLGNQFFVIAAIRKFVTNNERIVLVGFEEIAEDFPEVIAGCHQIPLPRNRWVSWNFVAAFLGALRFFRVISTIRVGRQPQQLERTRSLLPIQIFKAGWCQDEELVSQEFTSELLKSVNQTLKSDDIAKLSKKIEESEASLFFIHIRRGDYLTWPTPEFPAALPESWYEEAMDKIRATQPGARFLVFSDDYNYAEQFARGRSNTETIKANSRQTLALMSRCTGGIMSASSFSWWGAQLSSQQSDGPFIAPLYWITWGEQRWDSSHSLHDSAFLTWQPVVSPNKESRGITITALWPIPRRGAYIELLRATDLGVRVLIHFSPVGYPAGKTPDSKQHSEHAGRESHRLVNHSSVEINVGVELPLNEVVIR